MLLAVSVCLSFRLLQAGETAERIERVWTLKTLPLHVDHRKCCQVKWTLSVIN